MSAEVETKIRSLLKRFAQTPSWVVLVQLFLAIGWARAATAHATSRNWWNGSEVLAFLDTHSDSTVWFYRPFLEQVVTPLPGVTAAVVLALQVVVVVLLISNVRLFVGLALGMFLNLQFMLAGGVNPSVFYLVSALAIVSWHVEGHLSASTGRRFGRRAAGAAVVVIALLVPSVSTLRPEDVIEDPGMVLIFVTLLFSAATGLTYLRLQQGTLHRRGLEVVLSPDRGEAASGSRRRPRQLTLFDGHYDENRVVELALSEHYGAPELGGVELIFDHRLGHWRVVTGGTSDVDVPEDDRDETRQTTLAS